LTDRTGVPYDRIRMGTDAMPTSDFRELPPPRPLAQSVECFWVRTTGDDGTDLRPRILPDGCIDIVWIGDLELSIVGPATQPVLYTLPPRCISAGVRFRPGVAPALLGIPACEMLNREIPLRAAWGTAASELAARVGALPTGTDKVAALAAALIDRLAEASDPDHLVVAAAVWLGCHPAGRVQELTDRIGLSERQLRRRFEAAAGYSPKTLHRILRFQRWLRSARQPAAGGFGLAGLAGAAGYADQAHMTREVSRLAGVPPVALLSETV